MMLDMHWAWCVLALFIKVAFKVGLEGRGGPGYEKRGGKSMSRGGGWNMAYVGEFLVYIYLSLLL